MQLAVSEARVQAPRAEAVKQAAAIVETDTSEQARSKIDMLLPPDSEES